MSSGDALLAGSAAAANQGLVHLRAIRAPLLSRRRNDFYSGPASRLEQQHVTRDTPPSFVFAAMDDDFIMAENSLLWVSASRKAGAPLEAHFFADGGPGFGLHPTKDMSGSRWPDLFALWMRKHGGSVFETFTETVDHRARPGARRCCGKCRRTPKRDRSSFR